MYYQWNDTNWVEQILQQNCEIICGKLGVYYTVVAINCWCYLAVIFADQCKDLP